MTQPKGCKIFKWNQNVKLYFSSARNENEQNNLKNSLNYTIRFANLFSSITDEPVRIRRNLQGSYAKATIIPKPCGGTFSREPLHHHLFSGLAVTIQLKFHQNLNLTILCCIDLSSPCISLEMDGVFLITTTVRRLSPNKLQYRVSQVYLRCYQRLICP